MVRTGHRNVLSEPLRWTVAVCLLLGCKLHFRKKQSFISSVKNIQFNRQSVLLRDAITSFCDHRSVRFFQQMFIRLFCQWQIIFFPYHQSFGLVGQHIILSFFSHPHHRFRAKIRLFHLHIRILCQIFRQFFDQIFSFDLHPISPSAHF